MRWTWWTFGVLLVAGIATSVVVSLAGSRYGWGFLLLPFLFPPFFMRRGPRVPDDAPHKTCPACGYATDDPLASFCPRDGTALR